MEEGIVQVELAFFLFFTEIFSLFYKGPPPPQKKKKTKKKTTTTKQKQKNKREADFSSFSLKSVHYSAQTNCPPV